MYERNDLETIAGSDEVLWLNEKLIDEGLDHKHLKVTTAKYLSDNRKHRYELVDEPKNNPTEFLYTRNWKQDYDSKNMMLF